MSAGVFITATNNCLNSSISNISSLQVNDLFEISFSNLFLLKCFYFLHIILVSFCFGMWDFISVHCVKSVRIRSYCQYLPFRIQSRIRTKYGEIQSISTYSLRMRENADQNNSKYEHFLRSGSYAFMRMRKSSFREKRFSKLLALLERKGHTWWMQWVFVARGFIDQNDFRNFAKLIGKHLYQSLFFK